MNETKLSIEGLQVLWKVEVPQLGFEMREQATSPVRSIEGVLMLSFEAETCKIVSHRLQYVIWNGVTLDAPAIGESLRIFIKL